jgi:intracellular multiplication protein IcmL
MIQLFKPFSAWVDKVPDGPLMPNPTLAKALGAIGLVVLASLVIAGSAIVARISAAHRPPPAVFLSQNGQLQRIQTLTDPSLSTTKLQRWVTRSTREIFSFNFTNYNAHVDEDQVFFTDLGYDAFKQGLVNSKIEDRIKTSQLDVFLVPVSTARVVDIRDYKNGVVFKTQMPALMIYKSASNTEIKSVMVMTSVRQVPTSENPDGLGIADIVLRNTQ